MRRRFRDELAELADTYIQTLRSPGLASVAAVQDALRERPAIFVGSGGALAVAAVAADEHVWRTGHLAVATSPLRMAGALRHADAAVVLFSARAKHPDVLAAARLARSAPAVYLVTGRPIAVLDPKLVRLLDAVVHIPPPTADGFLATNSVVTLLTAWLAACSPMPETLPAVTELLPKLPTQDFRRLFVLHGAYGLGPALDLEARANETGAADVQLADYRNAAHGRHVGLAARAEDTLVVALRDGDDAALPERTLSLLPRHIARVELTSPLQFPASAADQTVRVIRLFGQLAAARGIDPGRPSVPSFGRRLYHLGWRSGGDELLPAVRRKLRVAGAPAHGAAAAAYYTEALRTWSQQLRSTRFGGVVLDYDGTCCTTAGRFDLPDEPVRDELTRLLDAKASLAFASGRGRSLHHDLRRWIPDAFWHAVIVGLYNGALILTLAEEVPPHAPCEGELAFAADRLDELAADFGLLVERRAYQITVTSAPESRLSTAGLASIVQSSLARVPTLSVTTARSAHSLDITAMRTSKVQVLEAVGARAQAPVIAVGDQGQVDGNDFGFLAAVPHSLSVDQCSADPTRCWNLGADDERGPRLLVRYLRHLAPDRRGQLRWQPR